MSTSRHSRTISPGLPNLNARADGDPMVTMADDCWGIVREYTGDARASSDFDARSETPTVPGTETTEHPRPAADVTQVGKAAFQLK